MYRIPIYRVQLVRDGSQKTERKKVSQPAVAAEVLWQFLEGADREHFVVVLLDTQNQIIGIHTVTVGTLDASLVHPREIFKAAIRRPPRRTAPSPVCWSTRESRSVSRCWTTWSSATAPATTASGRPGRCPPDRADRGSSSGSGGPGIERGERLRYCFRRIFSIALPLASSSISLSR